ncbi:hypothetical protein KI387_018942 [Taxus chinensis]|uniref:ABC transporter domain-containing protein n=1 Tax=Taxus chinensis TaxID=29808 RepID=A0AA38G8B3_TAXCH|nr:hypothetical protein KI387_018942 [Taxus chinensis]
MAPSFSDHTGAASGHSALEIQAEAKANMSGGLSPLSQALWKNTTDTSQISDLSAWLTWKDLTVTVTNAKGEHQSVLHGLTGYAEPGYIMAIMGPSGSGKSTLLDTLAGRLSKNCLQSGEVLVNGRKRTLSYGTVAYVTQEDTLIGTLTVRESIHYSAHLRLPDKMPREEKMAIVESTIMEMGLQECADTPIGNWHMRGLSGGEKRRVSIAIEILMRPRLLFLDEPTSGLDSASAFFVTQTVRNLARDGRTVIASIHQPSSEVFALFDYLCLLSGGHTVYFGEASSAHEFFDQAGFPCPPRRNPSDHFIRCINSDFDRVKATLKGSFRLRITEMNDPVDRISTAQAVKILLEHYRSSEYAMVTAARVHEISQIKGTVLESNGSQASFFMQCYTLTKRSFVNMTRDVGYYWLRVVIYTLVTICIGTIYYDVGTGYNAILARGSCASYISGFMTFMSIGGFPSFVEDMKVFQRERLNGHYGVSSFVIANTLSSMPYLALVGGISGSIAYFMVKLHPGFSHFAFFVLNLFLCMGVVESLMMTVAALVPNFLMGIITGAGILGIYMLVAGYFRFLNDLPKAVWRYPMSYISFNSWALQGQYKNDLLGIEFDPQLAGMPKISGEYILQNIFEINAKRSKWWDLAIIFSMIFIYRFIFFLVIKYNEKVAPSLRAILAKHKMRIGGEEKQMSLNTISPATPPTPSPQPSTST